MQTPGARQGVGVWGQKEHPPQLNEARRRLIIESERSFAAIPGSWLWNGTMPLNLIVWARLADEGISDFPGRRGRHEEHLPNYEHENQTRQTATSNKYESV